MKITLADDGQLVVDKAFRYRYELGQWDDPSAYVKFTGAVRLVPDTEKRKSSIGDLLTNNYVWKSIFRHGYEDTPATASCRSRATSCCTCTRPRCGGTRCALRFTWCTGGITFLSISDPYVTGVILMFYYRPTGEYAYHDMKYLQFDVPFGMIMRNMHRWAAHAMVIAVWLHMFRVFMTGSYKPPREFNWVIGVNLLVITLLLSFTGYLLPWDQLVDLGRHRGHQHGARDAARSATKAPSPTLLGVNAALRRARAAHRRPPGRRRRRCSASTCCTASSSRSSRRC